jgi:hypothetical protein
MSGENIFSALAKYNSATDENYLTESFVFVINTLLRQEHLIGLGILTQLCADNKFSFGIDEDIAVLTQAPTEQGTPDIKVSSPDKLIYIEVKHDSLVDSEQLKRYKKDLESSSATIKRLILLTKFPVDFNEHQGIPDKHVRWFEVYNWLADARTTTKDVISVYLMDSFKSFLEVKGMSIQKVGWEYINGVPAFNNLIDMIEVPIQNIGIPFSKSTRWERKGFVLENNEFWCGIYLYMENHLMVIFQIEDKKNFDRKLLDKPSYPVKEDEDNIWFRLQLEDIHFFSLDKDRQLEEITKFVRTAYTEAQQMRIK